MDRVRQACRGAAATALARLTDDSPAASQFDRGRVAQIETDAATVGGSTTLSVPLITRLTGMMIWRLRSGLTSAWMKRLE